MIISVSPATAPLWSWKHLVEYNQTNITEYPIHSHNDHDNNLTPLVIIVVGIVIIFAYLVFKECLEEGRQARSFSIAGMESALIHVMGKNPSSEDAARLLENKL
eukprot:GFUD01084356.1.p1 GENE.GFUD01084356.1~~GFUD01084356.1.p1  ORF type:complete len:104 (-),score=12.21 GFUD01084356.1:256-567(-)